MISMSLNDFAQATAGSAHGDNVKFTSISIDSRKPQPDALFVAIKGPNFDAHDFIDQAISRGAVGLVVDRDMKSELPVVIVTDTRRALGDFANAWRNGFSCPVIGVTGSTGKTTVKNLCSGINGRGGHRWQHADRWACEAAREVDRPGALHVYVRRRRG